MIDEDKKIEILELVGMPAEKSHTISVGGETLQLSMPVYSKQHLVYTFLRANGSKAPKCIAWDG